MSITDVRTPFFVICLLLKFGFIQAQFSMKWGKTTELEQKMKVCSFDTNEVAIVLGDVGVISFDFRRQYAIVDRHVRIKILKNAGKDFADIKIPFYGHHKIDKIELVKGQTINFDENGKQVITKVNPKTIFTIKTSEKWHEVRIPMPKVSVGSIIEYKYRFLTKNVVFLEAWNFQREIPTLHSKVSTEIPNELDYSVILNGHRLIEKYREQSKNEWELENLPALKPEPYVSNINDYAEKIRFQLVGYEKRKNDYTAETENKTFLSTWEELTTKLLNDSALRDYLSGAGKTSIPISSESSNQGLSIQIVERVYNYISKNYSWDGKFNTFPNIGLKELAKQKTGNGAALNLLLISHLRKLKIEAYPILISTRSHGKIVKNYPLLSQFNHLISAVIFDQDTMYIDLANTSYPFHILPFHNRVKEGFFLKKEAPTWVPIVQSDEVIVQKTTLHGIINSNGSFNLESTTHHDDYFLANVLNRQETTIPFNLDIASGYSEVKIKEHDFNRKETSLVEYLEIDAKIEIINDNLIAFSPIVMENFDKNPFQQTTRNLPIENPFRRKILCQAIYQIPKGFEVEVIPQSQRLILINDYMKFRYSTKEIGEKVIISFSIHYDYDLILPQYYKALQEFYDLVIAKLQEKVILEKKE